MSKEVDNRVVSMEFDNKNFEKNVKQSQKSIKELDKILEMKDATKGMQNVEKESESLKETLHSLVGNINAFQEIAVGAFFSIGQKISELGFKMADSLILDPIRSGWQKYADETSSVQTIMSATGRSIEEVEDRLKQLTWFTDETSYAYTDMISNIGKFTSNEVDLDVAVSAMEGIANWAAISGQNAQKASQAMYNLSQAIGVGSVQVMDWKSIENANMATAEFKNAAIEAALEFGTLKKAANGTFRTIAKGTEVTAATFRSTLNEKWLTNDVLLKTLERYGSFTDALYKYTEATGLSASEFLTYLEDYENGTLDFAASAAKAEVPIEEFTEAIQTLGSEEYAFGRKALKAAQEAKTFEDAINATKDAVSTGWKETFKGIFGNYNEQRKTWTALANDLWDIFAGGGDYRNELVTKAFSSNMQKLEGIIKASGVSLDDFKKQVTEVALGMTDDEAARKAIQNSEDILAGLKKAGLDASEVVRESLSRMNGAIAGSSEDVSNAVDKYKNLVSEILKGDWSNGEKRIKKLTEANWDYAQAQKLVNKVLSGGTIELSDFNKEALKAQGFTDNEIDLLKTMNAKAEMVGESLDDLVNNIDAMSNREKLIAGIGNILKSIGNFLYSIRDAFYETFGDSLVSLIGHISDGLMKITTSLYVTDERADKLRRTFKGVFSIFEIIGTLIKSVISPVFEVLGSLFDNASFGILDMTAAIGDNIAAFSNWIKQNNLLYTILHAIAKALVMVIGYVKQLFNRLKNSPQIQKLFESFGKALEWFFSTFGKYLEIGIRFIEQFIDSIFDMNSLSLDNITETINKFAETVAVKLGGSFAGVDGILDFFDIIKKNLSKSTDAASSFATGIKKNFTSAWKSISKFAKDTLDLNLSNVLGIGIGVGLIMTINKISKFADKFEGILNSFAGFANAFKGIATSISGSITEIGKGMKNKLKAEAFFKVAEGILVIAAALALLSQLDPGKLWSAIGALGLMTGIVTGCIILISKFSKFSALDSFNAKSLLQMGLFLLELAAGAKILTLAVKDMAELIESNADITSSIGAVIVLMAALATIGALVNKYSTVGKNLNKMSFIFVSLGAGLWVLVHAIDDTVDALNYMKDHGQDFGTVFGTITILMIALGAASLLAGKAGLRAAIGVLGLVLGLNLLINTFAKMAKMDPKIIEAGYAALEPILISIGVMLGALAGISWLANGKNALKGIGIALLGLGASVWLIVQSLKALQTIDSSVVLTGALLFGVVLSGIAKVMKSVARSSEASDFLKASVFLIALSVSIGILAGICVLLGFFKMGPMMKGLLVIEALMAGLALIFKSAQGIKEGSKTIMPIAVTLGVLAAAVFLLSTLSFGQILPAVTALVAVMGMLSVIFSQANKTGGGSAKAVWAITFAIGVLISGLAVLAQFNAESLFAAAASMTLLLGAIAGMMYVLQKLTANNKKILKGDGMKALTSVMVAVVGLMAAVAAINRWIGPIELGLETSASLVLLFGAISAMLMMLSYVSKNKKAVKTDDVLALGGLFVAVGVLLASIAAINKFIGPINVSFTTLAGVSSLLVVLAGLMVLFSKIKINVGSVASAGAAMIVFVAEVMAVIAIIIASIAGIGYLLNEIPGALEGLQTGLEVIDEILTMLVETIGNIYSTIIDSIAGGIADGITLIAESLGGAIDSLNEHFSAVKPEVIAGAKTLAEAMLIFGAASFLDGITNFLGLSITPEEMKEKMKMLGEGAKAFNDATSDIKDNKALAIKAQAVANLMQALASIPAEGGLVQKIFGEQSLDSLGTNIAALGDGLKQFQDSAKDVTGESIQPKIDALRKFCEIADEISFEGGVWGWLSGDKGLGGLAENLTNLGTGLSNFKNSAGTITAQQLAGPCGALEEFIRIQGTIPEGGGLLSAIGKSDLGNFAANITRLGNGLFNFYQNTRNIKVGNQGLGMGLTVLKQIVTAVKPFIGANIEGIVRLIEDLGDVGKGLRDFIKAINNGISEKDITSVKSKTETFPEILNFITKIKANDNLKATDIDNIKRAVEKIPDLIESIIAVDTKDADKKAKDIATILETISNSLTKIDFKLPQSTKTFVNGQGVSVGTEMAEKYTEGLSEGINSSMPTLDFSVIATKAGSFFSGRGEATSGMANSAKNMVGSFVSTIGDSKSINSVKTATTNLYQNGLDGGNALLPAWKTLGNDSALGLINGLNNGQTSTWLAGFNLGKKAKEGAAAGVDSNSPSKEFFKIGSYCDDGMILGIESSLGAVAKAGTNIGTAVTDSVRKTMDINSPSRVMNRLGVYCGEGFAKGLVTSSEDAIGKGSAYDKLLNGVVAKGYKTGKAWVDEQKKFDNLSTQQEFIFWKKMLETVKLRSEDKLAAEEAMYTAGKKLADDYYNGIFDYISQEEGYDRMNAHQKLAYLKQFEGAFAEGTEAAKKYNKEVYDATKEDQAAYFEEFQNEIDDRKRYEGLTLEDELLLWQGYYKRLDKAGLQWTEEYRQVGEEIKSINKDLADDSYQKNKETLDNMVNWGFMTELDRYKQWQKEYYDILLTADWEHNKELVDRMNDLIPKMRDYEESESKHIENMYTESKLTAKEYDNMMRAWAAKMGYVENSEKMLAIEKQIKDAYDEENDALLGMSEHFGTIGVKAKKTAAIAKFIAGQYAQGTRQWVSGMEDIYDLVKEENKAQKEFIEGYDDAYKEYNDNRKDLEKDYEYQVKEINNRLKEDIKSLEEEYDDAVKSRADSLYSAVGLFDEVTKKEKVTAKTLRKNLTDQINEFKDWDATIDSLASRGIDKKLIEELQEMGVDSISEIKAMNSMTDEELKEYVALWNEKHALTTARAGDELADMRKKVNTEIVGLREDAYSEIAEYRTQFNKDLDDLNDTLTKAVETLLKAYNTSMYGENALASQLGNNVLDSAKTVYDQAKSESEKSGNVLNTIAHNSGEQIAGSVDETGNTIIGYITNDVARIADTIQLYDWTDVGKSATDGMSKGIIDNAKNVWESLKTVVDGAITETYKALSAGPGQGSIKFMDIGWSIDRGIVDGVTAGGGFVMNAIHSMTDSIVGAFEGMMMQIESVINGDASVSDIRPVFDMSNSYGNDLFMSAKNAATSAYLNSESAIDIIADKLQNGVDTATTRVVTAIGELKSEVSTLKNDIQQMKIVLDSGQLVGGIKNQMDSALGNNVVMQGRGVTKYSMG